MIYSPAYQGEHSQINYFFLIRMLKLYLRHEKELIINVDFLFDKELEHYFIYIFHKAVSEAKEEDFSRIECIKILSDNKKRLRKIKKILKKLVYLYTDTKKYKEKNEKERYYTEIKIYG